MREALLKKRYGIPTALLILLVSAGVATAFVVHNFTFTITTEEPLSFRIVDGSLDITYQGESDTITIEAKNDSRILGYDFFVNADVEGAQIDSISYSYWSLTTEQEKGEDMNGDGDMWDALCFIGHTEQNYPVTHDIDVTVDTADDAAPDNLEVTLSFERRKH